MPVIDPRIAGKPIPRISKQTMERDCVARVKNVLALEVAFLDQRIPRYERDIINMVGMGVTENAELKPNVRQCAPRPARVRRCTGTRLRRCSSR
jgi:hypothetical protein